MYAAELGVDPQADFMIWVSGATRISSFMFSFRCILDFRPIDTLRATGNTSRQKFIRIGNKICKQSARDRGAEPPRKQFGIYLGCKWLAP